MLPLLGKIVIGVLIVWLFLLFKRTEPGSVGQKRPRFKGLYYLTLPLPGLQVDFCPGQVFPVVSWVSCSWHPSELGKKRCLYTITFIFYTVITSVLVLFLFALLLTYSWQLCCNSLCIFSSCVGSFLCGWLMELISVIFVNCTSPRVSVLLLERGTGGDLPARCPCHTRGWAAWKSAPRCIADQIPFSIRIRPALLGFECILKSR